MPRRRTSLRRLPQTFDAIGIGEQLAWSGCGPCIEGDGSRLEPESPTLVWPSWEAWAEVYGACREDFLAKRALRDLPPPGSERIFAAIQAGKDPEDVVRELRLELALSDPRPAFFGLASIWGGKVDG